LPSGSSIRPRMTSESWAMRGASAHGPAMATRRGSRTTRIPRMFTGTPAEDGTPTSSYRTDCTMVPATGRLIRRHAARCSLAVTGSGSLLARGTRPGSNWLPRGSSPGRRCQCNRRSSGPARPAPWRRGASLLRS
jgi:hypothetical protein